MVKNTKIETLINGGNGNTNPHSPLASDLPLVKSEKKIKEKKKQANQIINWSFTFNNYTDKELKYILKFFKILCTEYVIGCEIGEEGTPHLQGNIILKKPMRWSEFKFEIPRLKTNIRWSVTRNMPKAYEYCKKEGCYFEYPKPLKIITELRPWQLKIEKKFVDVEPDGRKVNWYHENVGKVGKSAFCKYMAVTHGALCIQGGKLGDIMNIMYNADMNACEIVIIDVPRKNKNKVSYSAIECILNGMITNTKFETGVKIFNPPHVIIFSNFEPETEDLSKDRWRIREIKT